MYYLALCAICRYIGGYESCARICDAPRRFTYIYRCMCMSRASAYPHLSRRAQRGTAIVHVLLSRSRVSRSKAACTRFFALVYARYAFTAFRNESRNGRGGREIRAISFREMMLLAPVICSLSRSLSRRPIREDRGGFVRYQAIRSFANKLRGALYRAAAAAAAATVRSVLARAELCYFYEVPTAERTGSPPRPDVKFKRNMRT